MGDQLDTSIEILEEEGASASSSTSTTKSSSSKPPIVVISEEPTTEVVVPRGNALYARLAVLMGSGVSTEDALTEMKEMSRQIVARKRAAGVAELWDAGEELCDPATALMQGRDRPPPKRIGPPSAVITGTANRLHPSPSFADKRKPAITTDKSSSSGSEESQDATASSSASFADRAKASASEISKTTNKLCIICHESAASSPNPMLTCSTCTLTTHAKCAKPPVEKEDFSSPRFSYTCASCTRRPRSESPKPSAARHHSAILMTAPHDGRKKKTAEAPSKLAKGADEVKRRKTTEGEELSDRKLVGARLREKLQGGARKKGGEEKGGDE